MLADAAPKVGNGTAFNVVAKGDPRAELGNNTEYDMLALRKTVDLSESQSMSPNTVSRVWMATVRRKRATMA